MTPARLFLAAFAVGCVLSGVALASDTHVWNAETFVRITPSDKPGVEAEVTFQNRDIHPLQTETFTVTLDGPGRRGRGDITVDVTLELNTDGAADTITVTPPPGYIAIPPEAVVQENSAVVVLIYVEAVS